MIQLHSLHINCLTLTLAGLKRNFVYANCWMLYHFIKIVCAKCRYYYFYFDARASLCIDRACMTVLSQKNREKIYFSPVS